MKQFFLGRLRRRVSVAAASLLKKLLGENYLTTEELQDSLSGTGTPLSGTAFSLGFLRAKSTLLRYQKFHKIKGLTVEEESKLNKASIHSLRTFRSFYRDLEDKTLHLMYSDRLPEVAKRVRSGAITKDQAVTLLATEYESLRNRWKSAVETEFHKFKILGMVEQLSSGVPPFSDGVNTCISIIGGTECCADCITKYSDTDGNPKVFYLKDLVQSNPFTPVSLGSKLVQSWHPVLPPLHPSCSCRVQFVPPGSGWVNGKLVVLDEVKYNSALSKAVDTKTLSPTVKPVGPNADRTAPSIKSALNPPSMPGLPAPGNTAGPGRPSSGGPKVKYEYWSGNGQPNANGGWEQSDSGAWRRPVGSGASRVSKQDPNSSGKTQEQLDNEAINFGRSPTAKDKSAALGLLSNANITSTYVLTDPNDKDRKQEGGLFSSVRVTLENGFRAIMKPVIFYREDLIEKGAEGDGVATIPHGTSHKREEAAYALFTTFGLDHCPPTTRRVKNGEDTSIQQWKEDVSPASQHLSVVTKSDKNKVLSKNNFAILLETSPNPDKTRQDLSDIIAMDVVMNSNDRHNGNFVINEDTGEVHAIDHGLSFGVGMCGFKNQIFMNAHSGSFKIKVSPTLKKRMENTSMGDLQRALSDTLDDWEVGQVFLRKEYLLHLQETDGYLDYKKFQNVQFKLVGRDHDPNYVEAKPTPSMWFVDRSKSERQQNIDIENEFQDRSSRRELPHQLFEDFALDWIDTHKEDPASPHHETAKALDELGVFMPPSRSAVTEPGKFRATGGHKKYEETLRSSKKTAKMIRMLRGTPNYASSKFEHMQTADVPEADQSNVATPAVR